MASSSEEESDLSESEIIEYKNKPLNELRSKKYIVRHVHGQLRCPFCVGKKKQDYKYKDLLQHATGAGKGSARRDAKQRANHLALAEYLETDLAHEAEQQPVRDIEPPKEAEKSEHDDKYCWPWTGIIVNIVSEAKDDKILDNCEYWMAEFSKYKPIHVQVFWETAQAVVKFDNDWSGFKNAVEFEKSFEAKRRSKKEWKAQEEGIIDKNLYGWLARADDFESVGPIGIYLRKNGELQTISNLVTEAKKDKNKTVENLTNEIDIKNQNLDELQYQYNEKTMSLQRILDEKDNLHAAYAEETKKMQRIAREHVRSILDEQEKMNYELEVKKRDLDAWNRQLNKREALTERERQKLDEEKQMSTTRNTSLEMASMEQRKADENVLRLVEEQKKEKQEALNKVLQLERQIVAKQKLEMEIEELTGKLQVMRHLGDDDNDAVQNKIKEMNEELQKKQEEMSSLEDLNKTLMIKERQSNDELQEARKELIMGLTDMFSARAHIGIKRMGDIDIKPFHAACKKKYPPSAAEMKSSELCTLWQEKLRQPEWHPFKVIQTEDGNHEQIINENDEELKTLREEWGNDVYEAVGTALKEINEYNASGSYVVSELWNFKENRKATLKEVVLHCLKSLKSLKRKRT